MRLLGRLTPTPPNQNARQVELFPTWAAGTSEGTADSFIGSVRSAYNRNGVVFACIQARLRVFAEARFAWRRYENDRLFTSSALDLFQRPWPGGNEQDLWKRMLQDAILAGNSYVHRPRGDSPYMQRLRPDRVLVLTDGTQKVGYEYHPNGIGAGPVNTMMLEEVAHWAPIPDPENNFVGMSPLRAVSQAVRTDNKMLGHQERFFDNAATPNMVVTVDRVLTSEAQDRLQSTLTARHEGVGNAYKTMVLTGGADIKTVGLSMTDLAFAELNKQTEVEVAAALGVPPIMAGLIAGIEASTYSNYQQAMRQFVDHTIRPDWSSSVQALQQITQAPGGAELWYDDRKVAALQQDALDAAEILSRKALTIESLVRGGYDPDTIVPAVDSGDFTNLVHTGLFSVQLQPPMAETPEPEPVTPPSNPLDSTP